MKCPFKNRLKISDIVAACANTLIQKADIFLRASFAGVGASDHAAFVVMKKSSQHRARLLLRLVAA